jgi:mevalonate kinase
VDVLRIERDNTWGKYEITGNKHIEEVVHSMVIINHLLHSITVMWERLDRAKKKNIIQAIGRV